MFSKKKFKEKKAEEGDVQIYRNIYGYIDIYINIGCFQRKLWKFAMGEECQLI